VGGAERTPGGWGEHIVKNKKFSQKNLLDSVPEERGLKRLRLAKEEGIERRDSAHRSEER